MNVTVIYTFTYELRSFLHEFLMKANCIPSKPLMWKVLTAGVFELQKHNNISNIIIIITISLMKISKLVDI